MLKILTINIWNRQGPWPQRLKLLREGIQALEPDVIGLQEVVGEEQAREIGDDLGYQAVFGPALTLSGGTPYGNAILTRLPPLRQRVFPLPVGDGDEPRCLLLAWLEVSGGPLPVGVTHLAWKFHHGAVRERQVLEIARVLRREAPPRAAAAPLVLLGDFNTRPEASEIRFLAGLQTLEGESTYLCDCFGVVGEGDGYTYDARHNPYAAVTHEPPRRLDYIFVRGPDPRGRGKPRSARVVLDEVIDGVAPSDHWGVYAEIDL